MNISISSPDTRRRARPARCRRRAGSAGRASAGASATDNVGVVRYNVHRSTSAASRLDGEPDRAADRNELHRHRPRGRHLLLPGDRRGRGRQRRRRPRTRRARPSRATSTPPTAPPGLSATRGARSARSAGRASTDDGGVARYNVHRSTSAGFTPSAANRIAQPTGTSYTDAGLAAGTYYYRVTAEDAAGNVSPASNEASAAVTTAPPTGLVAALGFDEGAGTTVADRPGNGNNGTIAGATWTAPAPASSARALLRRDERLGQRRGLELARPDDRDDARGVGEAEGAVGGLATVHVQGAAGQLVYGLYAQHGHRPARSANRRRRRRPGAVRGTAQLALNTWTHLAATYDGGDARRCTSTARRRQPGADGRDRHARRARSQIGGNNDLARVVHRPDRRGARVQPRAHARPRSRPT